MSSPIITVENLSKKYRIRHQQQGGMRYKALRDVLADKTKGMARRLWSTLRSPTPQSALCTPPSEDFWALKDVSFEVNQGDVLGIIGRNGAGKSTVLKILSRITEPTTGRVRIQGRVASLLEVGTGFHPELTGRENIFLNGAILGMTRAEIRRKFDEIVAFAEVEKFLDTPVKRYSSGMYVRLAFAVAAHLEPEILIIDEVLAVGDTQFQKKCLGKMRDVAGHGRTVLFVSHNMAAVEALTSRALWLETGSVMTIGETGSTVRSYLEREGGESDSTVDLTTKRTCGFLQRSLTLRTLTLSSDRRVSATFTKGEPIMLKFAFEAPQALCDVCLGIGIETPEGLRVASVNSEYDTGRFFTLLGCGVLSCNFGQIPLNTGTYWLQIYLSDRHGTIIDGFERAARLEILETPVSRDGLHRRNQRGFIFWSSKWHLNRIVDRETGEPPEPPLVSSRSKRPS